jgi:hypothetical protein
MTGSTLRSKIGTMDLPSSWFVVTSGVEARLSAPTFALSGSRPNVFTLTWAPYNTPDASITAYDVEYAPPGGSWRDLFPSPTTQTAYSFSGTAGASYWFRVRALDTSETPGPYSPAVRVTVPSDQGVFRYSYSWRTYYSATRYFGSARYAYRKGAYATYAFKNAKEVYLITTKAPFYGRAKIYVNGVYVRTIDLYAPKGQYRVPIRVLSYSSPTSGTLKVVMAGTKTAASTGYRIEIDGVAVR